MVYNAVLYNEIMGLAIFQGRLLQSVARIDGDDYAAQYQACVHAYGNAESFATPEFLVPGHGHSIFLIILLFPFGNGALLGHGKLATSCASEVHQWCCSTAIRLTDGYCAPQF